MSKLVVLASLMMVLAVVPCNAGSSQPGNGSIKLITLSGVPVVDGVFLNGHGPYRFVLDTGSGGNLVDMSIAQTLGLIPTFRADLDTVAGIMRVAGSRIAEISLGSATASNQEILFSRLEGPHALSAEINGVLGQEFLAHFDYLLDFANHRLVFGELVPHGGNRMEFESVDGCPAIETSEGKLVIDSGTNITVLHRLSSSAPTVPIIWTASGTSSAVPIRNLRLRIAGHAYHPAIAAYTTSLLPKDGVVAALLFHGVFVSNSGKYVVVDPVSTTLANTPEGKK